MKSCIFILLYFQICFATSNTSSTSNTSNTSNTSSSNNAVDTITSSLEEGVHDRDRDHGNNHNDVTSSMDMDISMNMDMNMNMNDDIDDKCSNPNVNVNVHKNSNAQYSFKNQLIMALLKHKLQNPYDGNNDNNIDNGNDTHDYVTIGDDNDVNDDDGKYQSLLCWLYNLKLNIPDEHFSSGIFSVVSFFLLFFLFYKIEDEYIHIRLPWKHGTKVEYGIELARTLYVYYYNQSIH
jgi:hypothetical protein